MSSSESHPRGCDFSTVDHMDIPPGKKCFNPCLEISVIVTALPHRQDKAISHQPVGIPGIAVNFESSILAIGYQAFQVGPGREIGDHDLSR